MCVSERRYVGRIILYTILLYERQTAIVPNVHIMNEILNKLCYYDDAELKRVVFALVGEYEHLRNSIHTYRQDILKIERTSSSGCNVQTIT